MTARPALPAFLGLILTLGLAACGSDSSADSETGGLDSVTVAGKLGTTPDVTWKQRVEVGALDQETVIEGTGAEVAKDDEVLITVWLGNGYTKQQAYSSYDQGGATPAKAGAANLPKGIDAALAGHTIGSRVVVAAPPADAFGDQGQPDLGIGNTDTVVFVVDLMGSVLDGPEGAAVEPPADAPKLVEKDGVPTGFDFSSAPKQAPTKLQVIPLVKGTGAKITKGGSALVNYLGVTYGGTKSFDGSYAKGEPFPTKIGTGAVIKGWDQALVGQQVGSRVELVIPPSLAYGDQKQGDIKPNSTLVFVIDVLAAY